MTANNMPMATGKGQELGAGLWGIPGKLVVQQAPVGTLSGIPLLVQPIIGSLTLQGVLNLSFIGTVTATVTSGPGSITAGATAIAVLGVALFIGLTITGSGVSTITFTALGMTPITAQVTIL